MKKFSLAAVLLCAILVAVSCKSQKLPAENKVQASSEAAKTETSFPETQSSQITVSSDIADIESEQESSEVSKPTSSKPSTSSKAPVSTTPALTLEELKAENSKKAQEIIKQVTNENMTVIEKAKATYHWLYPNFKYRTSVVDLSNGYTDKLTHELANYFFKYRKGSCEHYAAVQKILFEELGLECFYIEGDRYSYWTKTWSGHTWLMVKYQGEMYHVDGLYGGLFHDNSEDMFMVPDKAIQKTHSWNRDTYLPCTKPQILK